MPWTWEPNSRSGTSATTRATSLLRAHAAELAPERLGHAPAVHDLRAALAHAEQAQVAGDAGVVEQLHRAVDCVRGRGMAEAVGDDDPPVEALGMARVVLGVDRDEVERRVDVALLVVDAQVEVEMRPVVRK